MCSENYFGNPEVPGGECEACDCSNNVDPFGQGNCDRRSGECLKCLYNTAGFHCERCRDGYFGNAFLQQCRCKCMYF